MTRSQGQPGQERHGWTVSTSKLSTESAAADSRLNTCHRCWSALKFDRLCRKQTSGRPCVREGAVMVADLYAVPCTSEVEALPTEPKSANTAFRVQLGPNPRILVSDHSRVERQVVGNQYATMDSLAQSPAISSKRGAADTIEATIPCRCVGPTSRPGFTNVSHSSRMVPSGDVVTTATSTMRSLL